MPSTATRTLRFKHLCLATSVALLALGTIPAKSQAPAQTNLPVQWEELTGPDFIKAIHAAKGTCILPIGILEKHGPHLPIGSDLLNARYTAVHAAQKEYAVVFPQYYFGQIAEARHEPGTVAYPRELQLAMLQATTDEMGRDGCKKILIINGHGGNAHLLPYFVQTQLDTPHDYVVYLFDQRTPPTGGPRTSTARTCPKASTPASGGTPASPTTTPETAPPPPTN
jgi:creatinine amidohydrolase